MSGNFPVCLERFRIVRENVLLSGKFLYGLASFHIVWKVFGLSGTFPDCPESFLWLGKFLYCLEGLHIVWKVFGLSGTFGTFVDFKVFAFELIVDISMAKDKKAIKSAAITESAVCELCHRRFVLKDLMGHVKSNHNDKETVQTLDQIKTLNSKKVLHGVCLQEKFYLGKKEFLNIALKLLCKAQNEAVVESMGSMLQKHMKRNAK